MTEKQTPDERLIAAASDLLAALKDCMEYLKNDVPSPRCCEPEMRAALVAIKKATDGSSPTRLEKSLKTDLPTQRALDKPASQPWNNVKDWEPEIGVKVLFLVRGKYFCVGHKVNADSSEWIDELSVDRDGDPTSAYEVTHWMPLPKAPG